MKKISGHESAPHASEQPQPRRRSVYDHDGEYEYLFAQHWAAQEADDDAD
jgi:hypothetical protein